MVFRPVARQLERQPGLQYRPAHAIQPDLAVRPDHDLRQHQPRAPGNNAGPAAAIDLLVTPLKVRQIIAGRLFGIWGQYALVFGFFTAVWFQSFGSRPPSGWSSCMGDELAKRWLLITLLFLSTLLLVPVIRLNQSMARKHFVTSWIVTLTLGVIVPVFLPVCVLWHPFLHPRAGLGPGTPLRHHGLDPDRHRPANHFRRGSGQAALPEPGPTTVCYGGEMRPPAQRSFPGGAAHRHAGLPPRVT